jgi:hypothetical protein
LVAAGFTDERAILAAPVIGLFRYWSVRPPLAVAPVPVRAGVMRLCGPLVAGVGAYALLRLTIGEVYDVRSGTSMIGGSPILRYHAFVSFPGKIFAVFEFLWILPLGLMGGLLNAPEGTRREALVFALAVGCAAAPALLVYDIDRSLCYLLPVILLGAGFFPASPAVRRLMLWAVTAANLGWFQVHDSIIRYWFR